VKFFEVFDHFVSAHNLVQHTGIANKAFSSGNFQVAIENFTAAIELDPTDHVFFRWFTLSLAYLHFLLLILFLIIIILYYGFWSQTSDTATAQPVMQASAISPTHLKMEILALNWSLTSQKYVCFNLARNSNVYQGYSRVAAAHVGLKNFNEAEAAYQKALSIEPENSQYKEGLNQGRQKFLS
jgi:tetratricopeptide (TPR) repeat protein